MMHIKVKVITTPLREMSRCMSCCHYATGCQCGDTQIKATEHMLNTVWFHSLTAFLPPPLSFTPSVIYSFISRPCSPGLVGEWAAQVGCQGGSAPTAPGSDWSRSPWGKLPSSLLPVKPQLPERQTVRKIDR